MSAAIYYENIQTCATDDTSESDMNEPTTPLTTTTVWSDNELASAHVNPAPL